MANPITAAAAANIDKMCPFAKKTLVGSVIRSLATDATIAASITAVGSLAHVTCIGSVLHDGGIKDYPVFVAPPGGAVVKNVKILTETAIAANATDKWLVNVHNPTDTVSLIAAQATTASTAVSAFGLWSVGTIQNGTLEANDVVVVAFTGAGSVAVLGNTSVVVNYTR